MAKQIQGVLGGFSGRVGGVIGYRRGGRWCMRSMPASVHNPRTEAQQRHRSLFRAEVQLAARMRWPVTMSLTSMARERHMTAQNLFVKMNHCCFDSVDFTVDYSRLQLSLGRLAPVAVTGVAVEPLCDAHSVGSEDHAGGRAMTLSVRFEPCAGYRYDEVYLYAYSPSAGAGYLFNSVYRHTKKVTVVLPEWLQTSDLQLYLMCRNSRGEWSATVHATLFENNFVSLQHEKTNYHWLATDVQQHVHGASGCDRLGMDTGAENSGTLPRGGSAGATGADPRGTPAAGADLRPA